MSELTDGGGPVSELNSLVFDGLGLHFELLMVIHTDDLSDLKIRIELRHQWSISPTEEKVKDFINSFVKNSKTYSLFVEHFKRTLLK